MSTQCVSTRFGVLSRVVALTLTAGLALPAAAQTVPELRLSTGSAAAAAPVIDAEALRALAADAESGAVRVIVGLDLPFQPEGLLAAGARSDQRASIARAQAGLLGDLPRAELNRSYDTIPFVALTVTPDQLEALLMRRDVTSITPDQSLGLALHESTRVIRAPRLRGTIGVDGSGWAVAVIDTGIRYNHVAFGQDAERVIASACFGSNDEAAQVTSLCRNARPVHIGPRAAQDCDMSIQGCGHGTHVSAIVASSQRGTVGVAPGADIIAVNVFSRFADPSSCTVAPCARTFLSDLVAGMDHVVTLSDTLPIAAVNLSLGGGQYGSDCPSVFPAFTVAADTLTSRGVMVIAATGNNGFNFNVSFPACVPSVIGVGATDNDDLIASFSNQAPFGTTLMAPGVDINAAYPPRTTTRARLGGTSMAAPHVAGAVALLRQHRPNATPQQILGALFCTGVTVGPRPGRTDLFRRIVMVPAARALRRGNTTC